jgi:hypothetical protein
MTELVTEMRAIADALYALATSYEQGEQSYSITRDLSDLADRLSDLIVDLRQEG